MSNLNPDASYRGPVQAITRFLEGRLMDVHTISVGIVQDFDGAKRRASIQPALDNVKTSGETVQKPLLLDVPVLTHQTKRWLIGLPLEAGDTVLLVYSERGIERFKRTLQRGAPEAGVMHAEKDAIAIPGFGPVGTVTLATEPGVTVQSVDGETAVFLEDEKITAKVTDTTVIVEDAKVTVKASAIKLDGDVTVTGSVEVKGGGLTHKGKNVGLTHTHSGVMSGPGFTGPPI